MENKNELLKPFVKLFISDLSRVTRCRPEGGWTLPDKHQRPPLHMVWIQGSVKGITRNSDVFEIEELGSNNRIGSVNVICSGIGIPYSPKKGEYCQVLGEIVEDPAKNLAAAIRAIKIVPIQDAVLQEMWPIEVEELKNV